MMIIIVLFIHRDNNEKQVTDDSKSVETSIQ